MRGLGPGAPPWRWARASARCMQPRHRGTCLTCPAAQPPTSQAVEEALVRLPAVDPLHQHEAVRGMYSWQGVTDRTEAVYYDAVDVRRRGGCRAHLQCYEKGQDPRGPWSACDVPSTPPRRPCRSSCLRPPLQGPRRGGGMLGTLWRCRQCGPWHGLLCCALTAVGLLLWRLLDWVRPPGSVSPAPRFPNAFQRPLGSESEEEG